MLGNHDNQSLLYRNNNCFPCRTNMFKLNLGDTAHSLTEENFRDLGMRTDGYSGADIAIVVRDALMQVGFDKKKC